MNVQRYLEPGKVHPDLLILKHYVVERTVMCLAFFVCFRINIGCVLIAITNKICRDEFINPKAPFASKKIYYVVKYLII